MSNTFIARIENAGSRQRARRLVFSDGEVRTTSKDVLKVLALETGDHVDPESLDQRVAELESDCARERALKLVGYRERSSTEFINSLKDEGYSEPVVQALVRRFSELQLIDDTRFAKAYARTRAFSGKGRRRIETELVNKGIDAELAAEAAAESSNESEVDRARAHLRGATPTSRTERERLLRRLISRGFDMRTALSALDASGDQNED